MELDRLFYILFFSLVCQVQSVIGTKQPRIPSYPYIADSYSTEQVGDCLDATRAWVFKPDLAVARPDVVVYLHGFSITRPRFYQRHIDHLVRLGHVVVFPQFQESICEPGNGFLQSFVQYLVKPSSPAAWSRNAKEAVDLALDSLEDFGNVYLMGHSLGGAFAMMWAELLQDSQSPFPYNVTGAVLASPQPSGFSANPDFVTMLFPFRFGEDIDVIAAAPLSTYPVVVLHGADDSTAPLSDILPSFEALGSSDRRIYQAQTDRHGLPHLVADHMAALTLLTSNSMDWRFLWSGLDQIMLQVSPQDLVFDMGEWSDGRQVQPVLNVDL